MCEFTGWVNLEEDLAREKRIIDNMLHGIGKTTVAQSSIHVCKNALIGCYCEPMTKSLGNNKFTIACTGQLENSKEVVAQLRNLGMDCKCDSDTEIILTSYMVWGQELVNHLRGSYTFAVWDESRKKLLLVSDPLREKHLFYALKSSSILFASQVKGLLAHPLLDPKTARTLSAGIPSEIKELPPGSSLIFDRQGIRIKE